jgi:hypothetical protein
MFNFLSQLSWFEAVALAVFGIWVLISLLYQTKSVKWVQWLKYGDVFAMIPAWSFFAPNPGTTDVHLLYRDKLVDGNITHWREVRLAVNPARVVWNPYKRLQKGMSDMGNDLQRFAARHTKRAELILIHTSFIALLNFVTRQPSAPLAEFRQFVVARSFGAHSLDEADILFLSDFHRLEEA